jgi:DNA-binding NtrC family response regulator
VIDDDEALADLIRVVLEDAEYEVVLATGPRDLPSGRFDCVVTDLVTVAVYSYEEAQRWLVRLAERYPNIPVVVATAHIQAHGDRSRLGVEGVVMKPFDVDQLVAAVRAAITS